MAFNIWERWPWTSFQNLNLDWLMKATKQAVETADTAATSVGQFDARITQNTSAIEQLGIDIETISSAARVSVNSNLEAYYRGAHITGAELLAKIRQHGDLPYVEYNNEVYMLDSISTAGDMRFSMGHTVPGFDTLVMRHIMIPAASYNAAYSITNVSSGGSGSSNVFTVTITMHNEEYVSDHTFAEITSQLSAGRTPVFVFKYSSGYEVSAVYDVSDTRINIYDSPTISSTNGSVNISRYTIYSDNTIGINAAVTQLAALDNIIQFVNDGVTTNALLKTAQTLTAAEQAQVKQNLGITSGGLPAVSSTDNGKFLRVVNGSWSADTVPSAETTSFGP